jgi:prepilin-type processing-associated H-X9-DG protein
MKIISYLPPALAIAALTLLPLSGASAETPREQLIKIIKEEFPALTAAHKDPAKQGDDVFRRHVDAVDAKCKALMAEIRKTDPRPEHEIMTELMAEALPEQREEVVKAREQAAQMASANQLKQIGLAFHQHLADHGKGAATLLDLLPYLGNDGKALLSPVVKDRGERKTDYLYFGAGLTQADLEKAEQSRKVLACDRLDNHGGKRINAVFLDGHVESIELNDREPLFKGAHAYLNQQLTQAVLQGAGE